MRICPKCGKEYDGVPAKSRINNDDICSLCGHLEALESAVKTGAMSKEVATGMYESLKMQYK